MCLARPINYPNCCVLSSARTNVFGRKKDYWNYFHDCLSSNKSLNDGIRFVKSLPEVTLWFDNLFSRDEHFKLPNCIFYFFLGFSVSLLAFSWIVLVFLKSI